MHRSSRLFAFVALLFVSVVGVVRAESAPTPEQTVSAVAGLLREFLANVDDPAMHARFWADDLVYTSGRGEVKAKAAIVAEVAAAAKTLRPDSPRTRYGADEIRVRPYGNFAALNFRLLVKNPDGTQWFSRNSGAFLWRDGRWQVVTWQATREP
ncbi:MAG: DUF4440 domain-containing protein [Opitutae bacterium]|nr:DUF4440 domain-containing protein [Opitutae bacterium]